MNIIANIRQPGSYTTCIYHPTVNIIIKRIDTNLLLNNGLLPGGGVYKFESDVDAIFREPQEELEAIVRGIKEVSTIIQFRNFLNKRSYY